MRLANVTRTLHSVLFCTVMLLGLTSCGEIDQAKPTDDADVQPTSTTELFESPLQPEPTLPPLTVEPGSGGAKGMLAAVPPAWTGMELTVYFAPFYPGEEEGGGGIYVLEPSVHPSAEVHSDGAFQLGNIPPGEYVIAIGPEADSALVILDDDRPRVFEVQEGEILEINNIVLE